VLLEEAVKHLVGGSNRGPAPAARMSAVGLGIEVAQDSGLLKPAEDSHVQGLRGFDVLGRRRDDYAANKAARALKASILARYQKALDQSDRAEVAPHTSDQGPRADPILISFTLLNENLHVALADEPNRVPINEAKGVVAKKGGESEHDGGRHHELVQVSRLSAPGRDDAAKVKGKERVLLILIPEPCEPSGAQ
jgi:hypothetical protein